MNPGKQLPLTNRFETAENSTPALIIKIQHENGNMVFDFEYNKMHMTEEHAEEFLSLIRFAANELFEGRYPQFAKTDEVPKV